MNNLLSLNFWLALRPGALMPIYQKAFFSAAAAFFIAGVIFNLIHKKDKKTLYADIWERLYHLCFSNAFFVLMLLFFNYEGAYFLSARFWYLVIGVETIVWLFFILKEIKIIPLKKELREKNKEFKKYIP